VALEKASLVLGDEGAGAGAENGDLSLDFLDIVLARFEIDLRPEAVSWGPGRMRTHRGKTGREFAC